MKICLVSSLYSPYILGGAEINVERVARYLTEKNEVVVVTTKPFSGLGSLKRSTEYKKDGVKIYRFFPLNVYYVYYYAQKTFPTRLFWHLIDLWNLHSYFVIERILRKEKPDVVHTHNLSGLSTSVVSATRSLRIPHIHTLHDYALLSPWSNLLRNGRIIEKYNVFDKIWQRLKGHFMNEVDVVIGPSKFVIEMHLKNGFFLSCKKVVIPSGIEVPKRKRVEKSYEMIDILYVGQVSKHKGVHVLIKAFKEIGLGNARLHIVGQGVDLERFKKFAANDKRIEFYGFLRPEQLKELYEKGNLLVVPSICYDNSPTAIYESFSFGVPVIGSRIGGIPELIKEGHNGFLFEAGNVGELKGIVGNLTTNISQLRRLSEGAFKSCKRYDMNKHLKRLEKLYKEMLDK